MNRSHENSLQPGKSFYLDNKTELKKRNQLPAGIKIKDILSGKYKPTSRSKLIHFKNATAEQRKAFHAKNLPQRCLQNYHTLAHPAGMVINELVQLRNLKIEHQAIKPKTNNFGHRIVINGIIFAEAEDLNKADAKRQAYVKAAAIIFGPPNPDY
ncbi:unnamed protein product [Oikopleura dioica]|uniref:Uncharacterized protein n=1 Tax=Oikopleura dioica TaxID=34765 RepID=E4WYD3_OIKDI|nr:unnamed protein product [Oikopleura dioica]CBY33883.1 unnamed protein product [Oikopleura dioica]